MRGTILIILLVTSLFFIGCTDEEQRNTRFDDVSDSIKAQFYEQFEKNSSSKLMLDIEEYQLKEGSDIEIYYGLKNENSEVKNFQVITACGGDELDIDSLNEISIEPSNLKVLKSRITSPNSLENEEYNCEITVLLDNNLYAEKSFLIMID